MEEESRWASHEDDEARWQAVLRCDPRADGLFCYGVSSTGIYCRPTCPARRPARRNVRFFETCEEAEEAGFRPCLRCAPRDVHPQQALVSRAQHILSTAETPPSLAELGKTLGISPFHLQRLFEAAHRDESKGIRPPPTDGTAQGEPQVRSARNGRTGPCGFRFRPRPV